MANVMAILQEVDKCIRCNGCYISCKRTWNMRAGDSATHGQHKIAAYQRVVIKSQRKTDMGPFIRYSCWHCQNPPCTGRCPYKAITKKASGAVDIDPTKCNPNGCKVNGIFPCQMDCQRGGFPHIGRGSYDQTKYQAWKCTLCEGRAGLNGVLPSKNKSDWKSEVAGAPDSGVIPELQHQPTCVYTCPAQAMSYDTRANILKKMAIIRDAALDTAHGGSGTYSAVGDGSMFWVSTKAIVVPPKADPFIEDHVTPMVSELLSSPLAKAAVVPTLVVGGLLALSARRTENEREAALAMEGEV